MVILSITTGSPKHSLFGRSTFRNQRKSLVPKSDRAPIFWIGLGRCIVLFFECLWAMCKVLLSANFWCFCVMYNLKKKKMCLCDVPNFILNVFVRCAKFYFECVCAMCKIFNVFQMGDVQNLEVLFVWCTKFSWACAMLKVWMIQCPGDAQNY